MSQNFPPTPRHEQEAYMLQQLLACIVEGRSATYLSAPITTGKRFSDWCIRSAAIGNSPPSESYDEQLRVVIEANRKQARTFAQELRQIVRGVLIDPTALSDFPEWSQDDYRYLWAMVIERYVKTVILISGWEYSNGCAYEFLTAKQTGAVTLDEKQCILSINKGAQLIQSAIIEMQSYNLPTGFLECVLTELSHLPHTQTEESCID